MRLFITVLLFVLISFQSIGQETDSVAKEKTTICIFLDSLEITNNKLLKNLNRIYARNQDLIDSNSYLQATIFRHKKGDTTSFDFGVSLGRDLEDDLQWTRENISGYFRIKNTLVLLPFLNDSANVYRRVSRRQFCYYKRETIGACYDHCSAFEAGFKITLKANKEIKVRRLYFFKQPYTHMKMLYYRIRYRGYF